MYVMEIALSILFCLTPVALTVHLAIKNSKSNTYKRNVSYVYGGLWAIAFLGYALLFVC